MEQRKVLGIELALRGGGRPRKITAKQGGKPTTETRGETIGKPSGCKGVGVHRTRGRLMGTTEVKRFGVRKSNGRLVGSTEANGFDGSKAGGRPIGTTKTKGFGVCLSGGVCGGTHLP